MVVFVSSHWRCTTAIGFLLGLSAAGNVFGQYDAPATYYSGATGTGATLKSQLQTIVTNGMTARNYDAVKDSAAITDADPNVPGNILLIYTRASIAAPWTTGGVTWSREHIWPQSHLGASASGSTTNIASDQFNLRPINPGVNSSRSNTTYGPDSGTGGNGYQGGYYYPGDADAGDAARALFYMSTRYSQLVLVESGADTTGTQMGDLSALLRFNYKDVPDDFERRRNHAIYGLAGENSPAISNPNRQSNRNPYVDHPEYVWSVFADQQNDTRLHVGTADGNGGSTANVNLGRVLKGAAVPAAQNVTLSKDGVDGTYYSVTASGQATSSVTGRYNAFTMDTTGSRSIAVGLNTSTATAGVKSGAVTVDNLDVTTQGGAGRGANDANDVVNVSLSVLDASNSSFGTPGTGVDTNTLTLDLGDLHVGDAAGTQSFSIFNVASSLGAGLTAGLDLDSIVASGDTSKLSTNLSSFQSLAGGSSLGFLATLNTSSLGDFAATYTLNFSDENLPGTIGTTQLTLNLLGSIVAVPEPATVGLLVPVAVLLLRRRALR